MKKILILVVPFVVMLVGCATGYQPAGFNGGFEEFKVSNDTYMVKFRGNGYTSNDQAFKYALRRAAELTKKNGYRYFKVINSSSNVDRSTYRMPVTANTTSNASGYAYGHYGNGNYSAYGDASGNSTTTVTGGDLVTVERPSAYISIKLYKNNSVDLLDADVILSNFSK